MKNSREIKENKKQRTDPLLSTWLRFLNEAAEKPKRGAP